MRSACARLRERLRERGADGLFLPRTDEHGSEYLPPSAERVAWLTGFTGSAAQVVVLAEKAAVFSDGRYTVQLAQEVDGALFERRHVVDRPAVQVARGQPARGRPARLRPVPGQRAERERLEKAVAARGGSLVALDPDPVDEVWPDRPPRPLGRVERQDDRYAGESSAAKRARIGDQVGAKGADWLLLTGADSIAWLLNVRGSDIPYNPLCLSFALLGADATCRWFVDPRKLPGGLDLGNAVAPEPIDGFLDALDQLGRSGAKIWVDPQEAHLGYLERLQAAGARLVEADNPVLLAKSCKNPVEIEGAVDAQRRDGAAVARFLAWLDRQPLDGGLDEIGAAERLLAERAKDPLFRGESFPAISAHGPNGALPHYRSTPESNRPLTGGTLYLVDSGGQYLDATTDITRTVALGEPDGRDARAVHAGAQGPHRHRHRRLPGGHRRRPARHAGPHAALAAGLDFDHGTGHGVGAYLCVHEGPPRISKQGGAWRSSPA